MNDPFIYRDGVLYAEDVPLADIARSVGTPCYVYSRAHIEQRWRAFDAAFGPRPHLVCYAVKANSNLAVLNTLARLGAGFDIVSQGELERVLRAGGDPARVVFSGVGKTGAEMERALEVGVHCFNVESEAELLRLNSVAARMNRRAPVSLRVNPDVDARTHPYISTGLRGSKFGVTMDLALELYLRPFSHVDFVGIDCHIGSQLTEVSPVLDALARVMQLIARLDAAGLKLRHLDIGGGLGIRYDGENPPSPTAYVRELLSRLDAGGRRFTDMPVIIEPGRAIVGNAAVLLTRVEYLKPGEEKNFLIVDAAMNDLMRPALYDAYHEIVPVAPRTGATQVYDVVGPVCESGDFLGHDRVLAVSAGDLLAIRSAGAYGAAMSSNYNTRARAAEVLVNGDQYRVVRRRERLADLMAGEFLWDDAAGSGT